MGKFKMGLDKKQVMQISNDAFYYLYCGEEPLDESNMEEVQEIEAMFPNGYCIEDNWETVEDSDLIEITIIPYVEDDDDYDEYLELSQDVQLQIKWTGENKVMAWFSNGQLGTRELIGEFDVYTIKSKNRCFHTGDYEKGEGSLFFLKNFSKK